MNKSSNAKQQAKVVVIGSGISGLYCAYSLKKLGVDVMVLEANNWIGGRMKHLKGFVDWKTLDLGAEFIHGSGSLLNEIIDKEGWANRTMFTWAQGDGEHPEELFGKEYSMYYLGREKALLPYDTNHPEVQKVNKLLFGLSDINVPSTDKRTLEQYLRENGVSDLGIALADAGYSNSLCAVSSKMSLYETMRINQAWDEFGHGDYRLDNSTLELVNFLSKDMDVRTEWVVKEINHENPVVTITSTKGEKVFCQHVVVTVPLLILKDNSIKFQPPLPKQKIDAIKNLGVENAIKIVLTFSKRFWPSRLNGIVCADTLIPEMWFEHFDRVGEITPHSKNLTENKRPEQETFTVSAFACSDFATRVTAIPEKELIQRVLSQLDEMFGNNQAFKLFHESEAHKDTNVPNPATKFFKNHLIQDWSKEPFVKGGYSHPALTSSQQIREDLAQSINNRVFWAGEATHPRAYMTMHGAIETGEFAAKEIMKVMGIKEPTKSKL